MCWPKIHSYIEYGLIASPPTPDWLSSAQIFKLLRIVGLGHIGRNATVLEFNMHIIWLGLISSASLYSLLKRVSTVMASLVLFVSGPPPIMRLPIEVSAEIFLHVAEGATDTVSWMSFGAYNDALRRLAGIDPSWKAIMDADPRFWCKLFVDQLTSDATVANYVSRSGVLPLDITFFYDLSGEVGPNAFTQGYSMPIRPLELHRASDNAIRCLRTALPSIARWRRVVFWSSTDLFLLNFLLVCGQLAAVRLHSFVLVCPTFEGNRRGCEDLFVDPHRIFGSSIASLRILRVIEAAVPWVPTYFSPLEVLEIRDIPYIAWPTAAQLVSSITASPHLRELILGGGGTQWGSLDDIENFTLPALESLTIMCTGDETQSFLDVLSYGSFPLLRHFTAHDFDSEAWSSLLIMPFMRSLERVSIVGSITTHDHVEPLFRALTSVIELNFTGSSIAYLKALLHFPGVACPALRTLIVGHDDLEALCEYVAFRERLDGMRLTRIEYHHWLDRPLTFHNYALLARLNLCRDRVFTYPPVL
ncbi:hypothetical protein DFH06DRAFT_1336524 [Mycena polygramma]|nr:hypothetical protein DFH06DRAFT_1336524 [Mycena polygramma]